MKELSIEEKAKTYDKIIEKANKMHHDNCEACQMCIEELIPELKESEDEKMFECAIDIIEWYSVVDKSKSRQVSDWLKSIKDRVQSQNSYSPYKRIKPITTVDNVKVKCKDAKEYDSLYSQNTWKPADESSAFKDKLLELFQRFRWYCKDETPTNGDIIEYVDAHIQELIDTVKNEPTEWNEEDKQCLLTIQKIICDSDTSASLANKLSDWLKSLKDRVQPQQEWSEEDEEMCKEVLTDIIYVKNDLEAKKCFGLSKRAMEAFNWFSKRYKFFSPQSQWKPSNEQMKALENAMSMGAKLDSLYNDLKKLKEE